jgi:hypothetical protein
MFMKNNELTRKLSPEEHELEKFQAELRLLRSQLELEELDLATFNVELAQFESRYQSEVGRLITHLDSLQAKIAQLRAKAQPENETFQKEARRKREQADSSREEYNRSQSRKSRHDNRKMPDLSKRFREAARMMHPDLAKDDEDRRRRDKAMKAANAAFANGDVDELEKVINEWKANPSAEFTGTVAERLVHTIRQLSHIRERISHIAEEMSRLKASTMYLLKERVRIAEAEGRDLLNEMKASVQQDIHVAEAMVQELRMRA